MNTDVETAMRLAADHRARRPFAPLARNEGASLEDAYAIQDELIKHWREDSGATITGWKIGLTSKRMQAFCGLGTPIAGAILSDRVRTSPAEVNADAFVRLGLEMEIALRVGDGIQHLSGADREQVLACIDSVAAAYELVDDRAADYSQLDAFSLIADNSWNAGMVLGEPTSFANFAPLLGRVGALFAKGTQLDQGRTEDAGGDPIDVVVWLVAMLQGRNCALQPGQWVLTGSIMPTIFPKRGDAYRFAVEGLAPVDVGVV